MRPCCLYTVKNLSHASEQFASPASAPAAYAGRLAYVITEKGNAYERRDLQCQCPGPFAGLAQAGRSFTQGQHYWCQQRRAAVTDNYNVAAGSCPRRCGNDTV